MEKLCTAVGTFLKEIWKRLIAGRLGWRVVICVCLGAALLAGFYAAENWRGKRAWEKCKAGLAAKGAALEWDELSSPPIAEEDNFFAAPGMMEWFGGASPNELTEKLYFVELEASKALSGHPALARIEVVPADAEVAEKEADVVLRYRNSLLVLSKFGPAPPEDFDPAAAILPLIVMEDVPLANAMQNLARHAGINYVLDPRTQLCGEAPQPSVTIRWVNVTARQALKALLDNYNLERVDRPHGIAIVQPKDAAGPKVNVEAAARDRLEVLLRTALEQSGTPAPIRGLFGAQNLSLLERPISLAKPLRLVVRTDEWLTEKEMAQFLPTNAFAAICGGRGCFQVKPASASAYQVTLGPNLCCTVADYLAWTDRCQPELERIRAALRRPGTRLLGLCEPADGIPDRNFVAVRVMAQTLTQRAQCYLLLKQPEAALRELTLLHDLRRVLTCKPVTLVAAMVNVAVARIHAEAVNDGLRINAWKEPQLAVIEGQLKEVNLVPPVIEAFQRERLRVLQILESGRLADLYRQSEEVLISSSQPGGQQQLRKARESLLAFVPRGWVHHNMATIVSLHQGFLDAADGPNGVIDLRQVDAAARKVEEVVHQYRPETFIAAAAFPMFTRAWQTVESNQGLVKEALAACELERDHLAQAPHSDLPEGTIADHASWDSGNAPRLLPAWNSADQAGR